jgi:hypothetical protein
MLRVADLFLVDLLICFRSEDPKSNPNPYPERREADGRRYASMSDADSVEGEFESVFGPQYVRNNKSAGQKNLRCFPACSAAGHCRIGFCGGPIIVKAKIRNTNNAQFSPLDYVAYGDFIIQPPSGVGSEGSSARTASTNGEMPTQVAAETVAKDIIDKATRTDELPTAPLHKSSTVRKVGVYHLCCYSVNTGLNCNNQAFTPDGSVVHIRRTWHQMVRGHLYHSSLTSARTVGIMAGAGAVLCFQQWLTLTDFCSLLNTVTNMHPTLVHQKHQDPASSASPVSRQDLLV